MGRNPMKEEYTNPEMRLKSTEGVTKRESNRHTPELKREKK